MEGLVSMKRYSVECNCSSIEHAIQISIDEGDKKFPPMMYVHYFLDNDTFFQRLVLGFKYIFGYKCKYGHFGESIWLEKEAQEVAEIISEYNTMLEDWRTAKKASNPNN